MNANTFVEKIALWQIKQKLDTQKQKAPHELKCAIENANALQCSRNMSGPNELLQLVSRLRLSF